MTESNPAPDPTDPKAASRTPAGAESYPLEVPGDEAPLRAEADSDALPCPSCGAPRRLDDSSCLRCGWAEPGVAASAEASPDGAVGAAGAAGGASPASGDDAIPGESWDDQPLERPWPVGPVVVRAAAAALVFLCVLAGLFGDAAFPPGPVAAQVAEGGIGPLLRIAWIVRLLLVTGAWWAAIAGTFAVIAWTEDRRFGVPGSLLARAALVAAAARLAVLLPLTEPAPAFLVEGFLFLALATAGVVAAIRIPARVALAAVGASLVVVSGIGAAGRLIGWAILG